MRPVSTRITCFDLAGSLQWKIAIVIVSESCKVIRFCFYSKMNVTIIIQISSQCWGRLGKNVPEGVLVKFCLAIKCSIGVFMLIWTNMVNEYVNCN